MFFVQIVKTALHFVYYFANYGRRETEGNHPSPVTLTIACIFDLSILIGFVIAIVQIYLVYRELHVMNTVHEAKPSENDEVAEFGNL